MLLLGREDAALWVGQNGQDSEGFTRAWQGQVKGGGGWQRIGTKPRFVAVIEDPLGDRLFGWRYGKLVRSAAPEREPAIFGKEHDGACAEDIFGQGRRRAGGFEYARLSSQAAGEAIQGFRAGLALYRVRGLHADARCELADDQGNGEHACEGEHVLIIGNSERQVRRHAEEVEGCHTQE